MSDRASDVQRARALSVVSVVGGIVAAIAGASLGWDEARQAREVETYLGGARREFGVPA